MSDNTIWTPGVSSLENLNKPLLHPGFLGAAFEAQAFVPDEGPDMLRLTPEEGTSLGGDVDEP